MSTLPEIELRTLPLEGFHVVFVGNGDAGITEALFSRLDPQ